MTPVIALVLLDIAILNYLMVMGNLPPAVYYIISAHIPNFCIR